tara:strand:+ start:544 stop:744 length:201 start_codon:yes stop_codon:yes gene_type:complete
MSLPKIIRSEDSAYVQLSHQHPPVDKDIREWIEEQKIHLGADAVLQSQGIYYFCQKIIDAEFEEIE